LKSGFPDGPCSNRISIPMASTKARTARYGEIGLGVKDLTTWPTGRMARANPATMARGKRPSTIIDYP